MDDAKVTSDDMAMRLITKGRRFAVTLIIEINVIIIIIILYSNIQIQSTIVFEKEDHEVIPI